jgi:hypothetical protein
MTGYHPPPELRLRWAEYQRVPCDECGVPAGRPCENSITGNPFAHGPGHPRRIVLFESRNA